MSRRKKKKSGCGCFFTSALAIVLIAVILVTSGTLSKLVTMVEKLMYPLEYQEYIMTASEEYDLEPSFICAVIHTESGFEASAQSSAGACGLMQIMPETFLWLADIRGENISEEDILNPQLNIDYGCYYLRQLADRYGDIYTACAAYNAGNVVSDWLEISEYSDDGVKLYSIPYPETAGYVEKIRTAADIYERLYFSE